MPSTAVNGKVSRVIVFVVFPTAVIAALAAVVVVLAAVFVELAAVVVIVVLTLIVLQ